MSYDGEQVVRGITALRTWQPAPSTTPERDPVRVVQSVFFAHTGMPMSPDMARRLIALVRELDRVG